jgi:hypothetical protein
VLRRRQTHTHTHTHTRTHAHTHTHTHTHAHAHTRTHTHTHARRRRQPALAPAGRSCSCRRAAHSYTAQNARASRPHRHTDTGAHITRTHPKVRVLECCRRAEPAAVIVRQQAVEQRQPSVRQLRKGALQVAEGLLRPAHAAGQRQPPHRLRALEATCGVSAPWC